MRRRKIIKKLIDVRFWILEFELNETKKIQKLINIHFIESNSTTTTSTKKNDNNIN